MTLPCIHLNPVSRLFAQIFVGALAGIVIFFVIAALILLPWIAPAQ